MKKTLLLCFIHGFKGDDSTFGNFPEYLRSIVSHALPRIDVCTVMYPTYETRGHLEGCVTNFREWLLEKVIDLEVANRSCSPTIDPSVRVILIGHSMGGIVAADTTLAITSDADISTLSTPTNPTDPKPVIQNTLMFPYIQGVLSFDTPYLGISPSVVAHFSPSISTIKKLSSLTEAVWSVKAAKPGDELKKSGQGRFSSVSSTKVPGSYKWSKTAAITATSLAVAAYMKRDTITQSWSWIDSHLKFLGCLMKHEELRTRMLGMLTLNSELGVGFGNLYTRLGKKDINNENTWRTFCVIPKSEDKLFWHESVNLVAEDETSAHITMFQPRRNPGYYIMSQKAKSLIAQWTSNEWYLNGTNDIPSTIQDI